MNTETINKANEFSSLSGYDAAIAMAQWKDEQLLNVINKFPNSKVIAKKLLEELIKGSVEVENRDYYELYNRLVVMFPKGYKTGTCGWRTSLADFKIRMKKAEKYFEDLRNATNDEIVKATEDMFKATEGDLTYIPSMKYYVAKDVDGILQSKLADTISLSKLNNIDELVNNKQEIEYER